MAEIVLIADPSPMSSVMCTMLKGEGFSVVLVSETAKVQEQLKAKDCRLAICDSSSKAASGGLVMTMLAGEYAAKAKILLFNPDEQLPVNSGSSTHTAVINKPFKVDALVDKVFKMVDEAELLKAGIAATAALKLQRPSDAIVGVSPAVKELRLAVEKIGPTSAWAMICGDKGTDKEVVARTIHGCSNRSDNPFTSLSCLGQDPATLSHFLFGSAEMMLAGLLEMAHGGTFLLNDIEALPLESQEKLVHVLKNRSGPEAKTSSGQPLDVRLILGGLRQPALLVEQKVMHPTLAATVSGMVLTLKPLRECREDIMALVTDALQRACSAGQQEIPTLDAEVTGAFQKYYWPGNALEVDGVIKGMLANLQGGTITKEQLPAHIAAIAKMRA